MFVCLTLVMYSAFLIGLLFCAVLRCKVDSWRSGVMRVWACAMIWITGGKLTVSGQPPQPPFVLVCNHMTYVDVMMLYAMANTVFVSKAEVRSWPIVGWMVWGLGTIFVDRTRRADVVRVNREIAARLGDQQGLVIFPEGVATNGAEILRFKPSLLAYPAEQGIPVWYATLTYRTSPGDIPAHRAICWGGKDDPFLGHLLRFLRIESYEADLHFGPEPVTASDRKVLAEKLWEKMNAQFVPVVDHNSVSTGGECVQEE